MDERIKVLDDFDPNELKKFLNSNPQVSGIQVQKRHYKDYEIKQLVEQVPTGSFFVLELNACFQPSRKLMTLIENRRNIIVTLFVDKQDISINKKTLPNLKLISKSIQDLEESQDVSQNESPRRTLTVPISLFAAYVFAFVLITTILVSIFSTL